MARAILYLTADCPFCESMRRELTASGIDVEEIDVGVRRELIPELLKLTRGRRIVPVLVDARGVLVAPHGGSSF